MPRFSNAHAWASICSSLQKFRTQNYLGDGPWWWAFQTRVGTSYMGPGLRPVQAEQGSGRILGFSQLSRKAAIALIIFSTSFAWEAIMAVLPDGLAELKQRLRASWMAGDFGQIARLESCEFCGGEKDLDGSRAHREFGRVILTLI